jgi:hypothetical protein
MEWKVGMFTDGTACVAIGRANGAIIDPHVEPVEFSSGSNGKVVVEVHQIVRDLQGKLLADQMVGHIFQIENRLVRRFDIRGA